MKNIYKISISIVMVIFLASCSKDWLDINHDPNYSETSTVKLVFPGAVLSSASVIGGQYAILGGIWSQYYTQSCGSNQYKYIEKYNLQSSDFHNQFDRIYYDALRDFKLVREQATADKNWSYVLMTTIMEGYTYQVLTDIYDQIPYTDALQGDNGNFTPHYDSGQVVYDKIIASIDAAMKLDFTAETSQDPGITDFLFQGDMTKWKQFANTLKLKMYLRQCYARPEVAQTGISAMVNDPGFVGFLNENAAITQYTDEAGKDNPMYEDNIKKLNAIDNLKASNTFIYWLTSYDDPRLPFLFSKVGGNYSGLDQGDYTNSATPSSFSTFIQAATDPVCFISTAESKFLQAEAVLRGYIPGNITSLYNSGVTAAFAQYGIADSIATKYLADSTLYLFRTDTDPEAQLEMIIVQKWASMVYGSHGLEAFFEHNRTHYPQESDVNYYDETYVNGHYVYGVNGATNGLWPKRILFPDYEHDRNPNTPAEVPVTTKVWWDKK